MQDKQPAQLVKRISSLYLRSVLEGMMSRGGQGNQSDVARIREAIDLEVEGMARVFHDFSIKGRHEIIDHAYRRLGNYSEALGDLIGQEEAINEMVDRYNELERIVNEQSQQQQQ